MTNEMPRKLRTPIRLTFAVFPGSCAGIYCSPKLEEVFPSHRFHQGLPKTLVYKQLSAEISALRIKAMAAYPEPGAPWCEPLFTPEKWQKSSSVNPGKAESHDCV